MQSKFISDLKSSPPSLMLMKQNVNSDVSDRMPRQRGTPNYVTLLGKILNKQTMCHSISSEIKVLFLHP